MYRAENYALKVVAVYCAAGFITLMSYLWGGFCHPFSQFFAVNPTDLQCQTWVNYNRLHLILNVSSDVLIILVPISLITRSQMQPLKKFMLCCMFSLGSVVIVIAVLNKVFTLRERGDPVWVAWYIRESSAAMIVANLILCWPLFRKLHTSRSSSSGHISKTFTSEKTDESAPSSATFDYSHIRFPTPQLDVEMAQSNRKSPVQNIKPVPLLPDIDEADFYRSADS
jgi:hypothetical protein